jgi:hypothetical protein
MAEPVVKKPEPKPAAATTPVPGSDEICLVIDSVDRLSRMCEEHVCKANGWASPADGDYGAGWAAVRKAWESVMHKIVMKGVPVVNIIHEKVTKETINKVEVDRIDMALSKSFKDIIADSSDFIFYLGFNEDDKPTLFCKPTNEHAIGRRGAGDLDMSPMEPTFKALDGLIKKETDMNLMELGPMVSVIGRPKSGKTTFASEFPNAVVMDCENGTKFLRKKFKNVHLINSWPEFIAALKDTFNKGEE